MFGDVRLGQAWEARSRKREVIFGGSGDVISGIWGSYDVRSEKRIREKLGDVSAVGSNKVAFSTYLQFVFALTRFSNQKYN